MNPRRPKVYNRQTSWYREHAVPCPDCGAPLSTPYVTRCRSCAKKRERNPNWLPNITNQGTGRSRTQVAFPLEGNCEECGIVPATDRHHVDGNCTHISRENLRFLCHKCHMRQHGIGKGLPRLRRAG